MQIWELATGKLKLTLTGHIEQVRGEVAECRRGDGEGMGIMGRHIWKLGMLEKIEVTMWGWET